MAPVPVRSAREITVRLRAVAATSGSPSIVWGLAALGVEGRVVPLELDVVPGAPARVVVRSALTRQAIGLLPIAAARRVARDVAAGETWAVAGYELRLGGAGAGAPDVLCRIVLVHWVVDEAVACRQTRTGRAGTPRSYRRSREYAVERIARAAAAPRRVVAAGADRYAVEASDGVRFYEVLADPDDTDAPLWCSCRAGVFRAGEVVPCVHAAMVALHLGLDLADA